MSREENVKVFRDTESLCKKNLNLSNAIKESTAKQKLYFSDEEVHIIEVDKYKRNANVVVSKKRSYEAASAYSGKKYVCTILRLQRHRVVE